MMTCTPDITNLLARTKALAAALHKEFDGSFLLGEGAKLARTCANFTPPPRGHGSGQRLVERAIERDLKNLISEASPKLIDDISSRYGVRDIEAAWITSSGKDKLNLNWENIDRVGARLSELHSRYKNSYGRVPKWRPRSGTWKARVVVQSGSRQSYIKEVQQKAGWAKAVWGQCAYAMGDTGWPQWISRHFGKMGRWVIYNASKLWDPTNPTVVFGGLQFNPKLLRTNIPLAIKVRTNAVIRRTRLAARQWKDDIAAGRNPTADTHRDTSPKELVE